MNLRNLEAACANQRRATGGLVVVVHESRAVGDRFAQALCERGHDTRAVCVAADVMRMSTERLDVVIVGAQMSSKALRAFVDGVRGTEGRAAILAVVPEDVVSFDGLVEAGVDDFLRAPFGLPELIARVELRKRAMVALGRAPAVADWSEHIALTETAMWRDLPLLAKAEVEQMIGFGLAIEPRSVGTASPFVAARIPLTLTSEGLELLIRIGVDRQSGAKVAEALLGEPSIDPVVVADLAKEMANTIGGAVKRAASTSASITLGLPALDDGSDKPVIARQQFVFAASSFANEFSLIATVEISDSATREVTTPSLREGMVVVKDVCSASGLMLISAGTRLTNSTAALVLRHLGTNGKVQVIDAT